MSLPFKSPQTLHPSSFGDGFVWGTASSAYQYEGASDKYGKGPSIWDTFTHERPGKIGDGSNGTTAVDFYHRYKDDVQIMKDIGFNACRLSISWSRILPGGEIRGGVNQEGIKFYHDLIDELLSNGITPFVTLFHWDLPQALENKYMGFLSTQIVKDFRDYANLCFSVYGGKVKNWITLNEPVMYCCCGYADGRHAPGRGPASSSTTPPNSSSTNSLAEGHEIFTGILLPRCQATEPAGNGGSSDNGDPGREPYIVARNLLLAHAAAVKLYKDNFQGIQKGQIGIVLVSNWFLPWDADSEEDEAAVRRALDFMLGWFMEPLIRGAYPQNMIDYVDEDRLPSLKVPGCPYEVKGSYDFIGINYYTAQYVLNSPKPPGEKPSYKTDQQLKTTYYNKNNVPIGEKSGADWLYIYPKGIGELLKWIAENYGNDRDLVIYITENGVGEKDDFKKTVKQALMYKDASGGDMRTNYHHDHLLNLLNAMTNDIMKKNHVEVKGYFVWSLLDNYEWGDGYKTRFGLVYVDYKDGHLVRHWKKSATWFKKFFDDSFSG
ncbi:beta-glucosidase 12-like isoform X2 [Rhododendron vialii]|uniref:beta-glucosidase 12-like isoform X2 n=1 Tax=Rhododendron vialii TaxID=182163 RepID=UPI0026605923|nr:beta-glucosidase 12-like isoform X2 [Rhododendron vialii]